MIRAIITFTVVAAALSYSLAVYLMWPAVQHDHPDWGWKRVTWYALGEGAGLVRDWVFDAITWLSRRTRRAAPRAARKAATHARSGRAAVNRRRADRRRPAPAAAQPESAPQQRTIVAPIRQEPGSGPAGSGAAPSGGAGPAPAGAIHPVFSALISWILDQEHPDSTDFEEFHRQLGTGFLGVGEALHAYTEHLAEGGVGLDPVVVQAATDVAEGVSEQSAGIVDIFRKFHAVYAGYLAWLEDGHQNTHDGRWVRPESA